MTTALGSNFLVYMAWAAALGLIVGRMVAGRPSAGLILCFWVNMALNHLFAQMCWDATDIWVLFKEESNDGFQLTGNAMVGTVIGILVADAITRSRRPVAAAVRIPPAAELTVVWRALVSGTIGFLVGMTGAYTYIPSLSAVASSAAGMAIAALCLMFWIHYRAGRQILAYQWAAGILVYPIVTTIGSGFLGFGVGGVIAVACFLIPHVKIKIGALALAPFVCYAGISLWVNYAIARTEIRDSIWGGEAYQSRIDAFYKGVFLDWRWFDLENQTQLTALERLNQNILVGQAMSFMDRNAVAYGAGDTLTNAVFSLVPRALWADKPIYAGSGTLVTRYTGRLFAQGTAVGFGFVMEAYVNFGPYGVTVIYCAMALAVTLLDRTAGAAIRTGQPVRFLYAFAACQPLLNPLSFSAEAAPSVVGAVVCIWLFERSLAAGGPPSRKGIGSRA